MWAWLHGKGPINYIVPPRELPAPADPDVYVRQLDDEIAGAAAAGDLGLVDELTAARCRVLLPRGETP